MTHDEAVLWLAMLEKECPDLHTEDGKPRHERTDWACPVCHNTNQVPVLDLREPCIHPTTVEPIRLCPGWRAKQGRDALHEAMHKAGWNINITWFIDNRSVRFWLPGQSGAASCDDHIAAVKAIRAGGYIGAQPPCGPGPA